MSDPLVDTLGEAFASYEGSRIKPGVICVAVIPYVMKNQYAIKPKEANPSSPDHQCYELVRTNPAALATGNQDTWTLPFIDLNLDSNEDLLIVKVKRRPVVVFSRAILEEVRSDSVRFQDSFWCIPLYTLVDKFAHPQWSQEIIEDVFALTYRACFPLPHHFSLHDQMSALRFDKMQPIPRRFLKPTKSRVTKEWVLYLNEWAKFYITGVIGNNEGSCTNCSVANELKTARDLLMEVLAESRLNAK